MSSVADNHPKIHCNDGDIKTMCVARAWDSSPKIHISLGDEFKVYHVTIRARDESSLSMVYGLNMYVGNNENTATENEFFATILQTAVNQTYSPRNGEMTLGKNFFIRKNDYSERLAIREIEVYGVKP